MEVGSQKINGDVGGYKNCELTKTNTGKRPRGRPRKLGSSLPVPLSVQSTPSACFIKALETWKTAKLLGVTTPNESAVIAELRKSKRIQSLEGNNRV